MSLNPRVAIVIVNWNKKDYVLNLLGCLQGIDYDNYEIIVVDNASTDDSVKAITERFPSVINVKNTENLGGTGGFNTGLKYVLKRGGEFKYVWLLDNDVMVEDNTLSELVKVVEKDDKIGIAGSRIVDINYKTITLEVGAFFRWDTIGVKPFFRNKEKITEYEPKETEYVATCSALVRVSALGRVGLLDERLFIFWDDMDWGLYFKENSYKVIAVPKSIVYHPSFTERRRGLVNNFYYGTRNPLLVYTKHTDSIKRLIIFHNYIRYFCKGIIFLFLNQGGEEAQLAIRAVRDFCDNKWGKFNLNVTGNIPTGAVVKIDSKVKDPNILIIAGDIKENIIRIKEKVVRTFPRAKIMLLVQDDRFDVFKPYFSSDMIVLDSQKSDSLIYNAYMFLKIFSMKFNFGISSTLSPFSFALKKTYLYYSERDVFMKIDNDYFHIYKIILSTVSGEIASLVVTPFIYLKSLKYKSRSQSNEVLS